MKAHSQRASGNKQELAVHATGCPPKSACIWQQARTCCSGYRMPPQVSVHLATSKNLLFRLQDAPPSQRASGNKQELAVQATGCPPKSACIWQQARTCCSCYRMPPQVSEHLATSKNLLFMLQDAPPPKLCPHSQSSCQPGNDAKDTFFPILHSLSPVILANTAVVAFVLLCNSRFNFHCYTQHEPTPTQKLAQKWQL